MGKLRLIVIIVCSIAVLGAGIFIGTRFSVFDIDWLSTPRPGAAIAVIVGAFFLLWWNSKKRLKKLHERK